MYEVFGSPTCCPLQLRQSLVRTHQSDPPDLVAGPGRVSWYSQPTWTNTLLLMLSNILKASLMKAEAATKSG